MHVAERHAQVAAEFTRLVEGVTDWDTPTPVAEWKTRDVVAHLTSWIPSFLNGMGVTLDYTHPIPDAQEDPVAAWKALTSQVQRLLDDPARANQLVTPPGGGEQVPVGSVIANFYVSDIFMHSWDLAKSSGQTARLDPGMVADLVAGMTAMKDTLASSGQFGEPVVLDESHSDLDRLIAIIGRNPHWQLPVGS